jgi:hypothetical protein
MSAPLYAYDAARPEPVSAASIAAAAAQGFGAAEAARAALSAIAATTPTVDHIGAFVDTLAQVIHCPLTVHQREILESTLSAAMHSIAVQIAAQPT